MDCGKDVGGSVGPCKAGVAHGAGDHEGSWDSMQQVEQVCGFLDGVRSLGDHHAIDLAGRKASRNCVGQLSEVVERQRGTRLLAEVLDIDCHSTVGQAGNCGDQLLSR
jgi:hypothetical protein